MRRGFTLIELLVVIAIIAILAAILFPVFASARQKANQSACSSNARQIALSYYGYTMDNNEAFPIESYDAGPGYINWVDFLQPYIKNKDIFFCPSISRVVPFPAWQGEPGRTAYWTNSYLHRFFPRAWGGARRLQFHVFKWSALRFPSTTVAFCEGDVSFGHRAWTVNPTNPDCGWILFYDKKYWANTDNRHTGGGNYPFVDGHQKYLKPEQIRTDTPYDPGDPDYENEYIGDNCTLGRNDGQHPWFRP